MATLYGSNYQSAQVDEPSGKIDVTEQHGRVRRIFDSITLAAEVSLSDVIKAGVLPKDAKIINARFIAPSDGTTGQYDFGWASNGVDAADQDGIFAGASELDTGGGAVDAKMAGTAAGFNKGFGAETTLEITCVEATTASNGDELKWEVYYILD